MVRTLEEKRAFAKEHLLAQARNARSQADYYQACADAAAKFGDYCVARAEEALDEAIIDLMIAQWAATAAMKKARLDEIGTDDAVRLLTDRWFVDPASGAPPYRIWARA